MVKRGCGYKTKLIKEAWGYEFKTHQVLVTCMNCQWVLKILVKRGCGNNTHYSSGTCIYYTIHLCTQKDIYIYIYFFLRKERYFNSTPPTTPPPHHPHTHTHTQKKKKRKYVKWASHGLTLSPSSIIMDSTYLALFPKLNNSSIFFFVSIFQNYLYMSSVCKQNLI